MKLIILALALATPLSGWSQLSMAEYRKEVVSYSWSLKKAQADIDSKHQTTLVARTDYLPQLTADGAINAQSRVVQGGEHWSFSVQPALSQTIYAGGGIRAKVKLAQTNEDIAGQNRSNTLLSIYYSADYAYLYLWSMKRYLDAIGEYVGIIRELKKVVDYRFEEGYIAKGDLLMIESRLSEAEYQFIAFEQNYTVALHNLNTLRGFDLDQAVELDFDDSAAPIPYRLTLSDIIPNHPNYQSALLSVEGAQLSRDVTRAGYNPQLSLGVTGSWATVSPNIGGSTNFDANAFLKLSVPIFHFFERHKAVAAAQYSVDQYEYTLFALLDEIRQEEANTWAQIIDSHAQMISARESLDIASESLEISTYSYSEGLTTILDVMQAQISWIQLYTNAISSKFNYNLYISEYNRITANFNQ